MKRACPFPDGFERWPKSTDLSPLGYDYGYFEGSAFRGEMHPVVPADGSLMYWTGRLWRAGETTTGDGDGRQVVYETRADDPWSVADDLVAFAAEPTTVRSTPATPTASSPTASSEERS